MDDRVRAEQFSDMLDQLLAGEPVETEDDPLPGGSRHLTTADERDGELASLLDVAHCLGSEAPPDEPDPIFRASLRAELVGEASIIPLPTRLLARRNGHGRLPGFAERSPVRLHWWWRLGAACAAVALFAVLAWLGARIPFGPGQGDGLSRLPSLLSVASAYAEEIGEDVASTATGLLGEVTFRLSVALPSVPEKARVYRQVGEPIDAEGARELAERLGIARASVVDDGVSGTFVVQGEGGRLVVSKAFRGYFSFETQVAAGAPPLAPAAPPPSLAPPGATVTPAPSSDEAIRLAAEFLRARGLLPLDHVAEMADDAPPGVTLLYRKVTFIPTVEGRAVRGLGITVTVGPGGKVTAVQSAYAKLAAGDAYPIISAEEAYRRLEAGRPDLLQARQGGGSSASGFSSAAARPIPAAAGQKEESLPYQVGEAVEMEGLLSAVAYEAKDGSRRYVATMAVGPKGSPTRVQFTLVGDSLEELCKLDQQHVRLWGRVLQLSTQPLGGRLRVERFEKLYPEERLVALLGQIEIEGEGSEAALVLSTDDGQRYALESSGGTRSYHEYKGRRMIVEGRSTQRTSEAGYPVLELAGMSGGTNIDRLKDLSDYPPRQHPQVIPERPPMITGEVAVKRAALEYYATPAVSLPYASANQEPFLLVQPVYAFSGTFGEGMGYFEAYVQAVRPEFIEQRGPS